MSVIDADGHVLEPVEMFDELPEEFYPKRPLPVFFPSDTERGIFNGCWIIEGKTYPTIGSRGGTIFPIPGTEALKKRDVSVASQTLSDVQARIADLDRIQIDVQVVFPTLFLVSCAEDVKFEAALFQAYNTYMGRVCGQSNGRVRWAAPVSFRDTEAGVQEMRRVHDLGAAGIFTMGMVWDKTLCHPSFFPIYKEAESLDLPVCVHLGWSTPQVTALFVNEIPFFSSAIVPVMWGFMHTMAAGLLSRFTKLRIGFLETGAAWVPYAMQQLRRNAVRLRSVPRRKNVPALNLDPEFYRDPGEWFSSGRAFINCEGDEDFDYLLKYIGEDSLMCSSDFPHTDASAEENYVNNWRQRTDLPEGMKKKVLGENAARFFRLS